MTGCVRRHRRLARGPGTLSASVEYATLCLVEVSPHNAPSYHCIPTPRDTIARLLHRADIRLPKAFSLSSTRVSTKKKLQSERLAQ
jgi:hypothetical protein